MSGRHGSRNDHPPDDFPLDYDLEQTTWQGMVNAKHPPPRRGQETDKSPPKRARFASYAEEYNDDEPFEMSGALPGTAYDTKTEALETAAANAQLQAEAASQNRSSGRRGYTEAMRAAQAAESAANRARAARTSRASRSRSPVKATTSATTAPRNTRSRSPTKATAAPRATRSRSPIKAAAPVPATSTMPQTRSPSRANPRGPAPFFHAHALNATPEANLTPQERKDNELDQSIIERLAWIRNATQALCDNLFSQNITLSKKEWHKWLTTFLSQELVSWAGKVADGGPRGVQGWRGLLCTGLYRKGLAYAIIQRVLKEHLFGSLLFGAPQDLTDMLEKMEKEQEEEGDGFSRTEARAQVITSYELSYRMKINTCTERKQANLKLALQIAEMLQPLLLLDDEEDEDVQEKFERLMRALIKIVTGAAALSTQMKVNGNTVLYYWQPVYKDCPIEPVQMDILNFNEMCKELDKEKKEDDLGEALVKIVCAFQLVAFRKGGGVMAERILEREENGVDYSVAPELRHRPRNEYYGRIITAQDGFRSKYLAKAVVVGRWGQPRGMGSDEDLNGDKYVDLVNIDLKKVALSKDGCGVM